MEGVLNLSWNSFFAILVVEGEKSYLELVGERNP